jgi:hypothetical protein
MKIFVAKEITVDEARELFGDEFKKEYENFKDDQYLDVGDHIVTKTGLVLLAGE